MARITGNQALPLLSMPQLNADFGIDPTKYRDYGLKDAQNARDIIEKSKVQGLLQQAIQGGQIDPAVAARIASADPAAAQGLLNAQTSNRQQAAQQQNFETTNLQNEQAKKKYGMALITQISDMMQSASDPAQKERIYQMGLKKAQQIGLDLTDMPPNFTPEAEKYINDLAGKITQRSQVGPTGSSANERMISQLMKPESQGGEGLSYGQALDRVTGGKIPFGYKRDAQGNVVRMEGADAALTKENYSKGFGKKTGELGGSVAGDEAAIKAKIEREKAQAKSDVSKVSETKEELLEMKSNLPSLEATVEELKDLSKDATYTIAGKAYDFAGKELLGATTEGAEARTAFESKVDNQILPLLKQTFGAQFTAAEGDRLRATLGDVDASPKQKMAAINAFITQSRRNIESKERKIASQYTGRDRSFNTIYKKALGENIAPEGLANLKAEGITPATLKNMSPERRKQFLVDLAPPKGIVSGGEMSEDDIMRQYGL